MRVSPKGIERMMSKLDEEMRIRKFSSKTRSAYSGMVAGWLRSGMDAREYMLSRSELSRSTVRLTYFALAFFHENVLGRRMDAEIPLVRKKPKVPRVISMAEVKKMIDGTENLKHRLVLMFLYYSGLRCAEVRSLKWEDVVIDRGVVTVRHGKGDRDRVVFLHPEIAGALKIYLPDPSKRTGLVLPSSRTNGKLSSRTVQYIVRDSAKRAGITGNISPHTLRHCFATHLLEGGADLIRLQQLMGHKSLSTTRIYTNIANMDMAKLAAML